MIGQDCGICKGSGRVRHGLGYIDCIVCNGKGYHIDDTN